MPAVRLEIPKILGKTGMSDEWSIKKSLQQIKHIPQKQNITVQWRWEMWPFCNCSIIVFSSLYQLYFFLWTNQTVN